MAISYNMLSCRRDPNTLFTGLMGGIRNGANGISVIWMVLVVFTFAPPTLDYVAV
jgi:hypothetical protein